MNPEALCDKMYPCLQVGGDRRTVHVETGLLARRALVARDVARSRIDQTPVKLIMPNKTNAESAAPPAAAQPPVSFEQAMAELAQLVTQMESGQLPLEASVAAYARGSELVRYCAAQLEKVESQARCSNRSAPTARTTYEHCPGLPGLDEGRAGRHGNRARALPAGRDRRAREAARSDALHGAGRRQARAPAARACERRPVRRRARCARARGQRRRNDPRVFARARRHAVHGRRRPAPRQADGARRVRRSDGAARRRRAAGASVRSAGRDDHRAGRAHGHDAAPAGRGGGHQGHVRRPGDRPGQRRRQPHARTTGTHAPAEDGRHAARLGAAGRAGRPRPRVARAGSPGRVFARHRSRVPGRGRHPRRDGRFGHAGQDGRQGCGRQQADLCVDSGAGAVEGAGRTTAAAGARRARAVRRTSTAAARDRGPDRAAEGINETARQHQRPGRPAQAAAHPAHAAGARTACIPPRFRVEDRRPPVVEPRHRGTDDRAALRVQHAGRPHRVGRRPPDLFAQDPHGPARAHAHAAPAERPVRLPQARRKRIRHVRHGALVDVDLGGPRHGHGREDQGRKAQGDRRHRRRLHDRRHGVRGAEQRGCRGRRGPARRPERQRHVDLAAGRCIEPLPGAPDVGPVLRGREKRRQDDAARADAGTGKEAGRTREGHGGPGHHVRGIRLQLHRPHRRPRPRFADPDAGKHQEAQGPAIPARRDEEGPGLQAGRGRADPVPRHGQVQPERRHQARQGEQDHVHRGVRQLAVRHGARRQAPRRHHARDARRLGHGPLQPGIPGPLLRRGHRRAAFRDVRRRPRDGRHEARRRDLLDVPAARLRPVDPRRGAAEPGRDVRAGPRGPRRRGRRHARGQLRHRLPALHPEHGRDGAVGRKRVPQDADDRVPFRRPGRRALPARCGRRRGHRAGAGRHRDRQGRDPARRQGRRDHGLRLDGGAEPGRRGQPERDRGRHALREAARHRTRDAAGARPRLPGDGGRGLHDGRRRFRRRGGAGGSGHRQAPADPGPAGPLHRPWRPRPAAGVRRPGCARHRAIDPRTLRHRRAAPGGQQHLTRRVVHL
ncbi:hypothetical protein Lal_00014766 [Lupinus albus]|nr:hypothetical protein Lal_00014766 [Lupinus albus]